MVIIVDGVGIGVRITPPALKVFPAYEAAVDIDI